MSLSEFFLVFSVCCLAPIGASCRAARIAGIPITRTPEPFASTIYSILFCEKNTLRRLGSGTDRLNRLKVHNLPIG